MEFLPIMLVLLSIAFIAQCQAVSNTNRDAVVRSVLLRQFLDRYQPVEVFGDHVIMRRFDVGLADGQNAENIRPVKRNSAEMVNHIIKNFGAIDRLGDVGK
uniref:Venom protein n=1 Tax=Panagrellus redivivus TaxID=6233 RepID=A0A7E4ZYY0_PANRE